MSNVLKKLGIANTSSIPSGQVVRGLGLVQHFIEESRPDGITLFKLKKKEFDALLEKLPNDYRLCYISDDKLHELHIRNGIAKSKILREDILPDIGNIKSGDFGEIFCYLFFKEHYLEKGIELKGLPKWHWKDNRNKPAPGTDIVLFHMRNWNKASSDDFLISIESKMKATSSKDSQLNNAIEGAASDATSRLVSSLELLRAKLSRDGRRLSNEYKIIERFRHPDETTTYLKKHKAVAIVDELFLGDELKSGIPRSNIIVKVFSIASLKDLYESVFKKIPEAVDDK